MTISTHKKGSEKLTYYRNRDFIQALNVCVKLGFA